ncbi:MAG: galactokinase [Acidimicrobiales bacterium]
MTVRAFAPGRVNLIGDHTDHTGGWVLPMAIHLGTTVVGERGGEVVELRSADEPDPAVVALADPDAASVGTGWARMVAAVVAEVRPSEGFAGRVTTTLPIGAGLSSSASLQVAVALALGAQLPPLELAQACQRAEQRSTGVPCGVMDQLASVAGEEGSALLIDTTTGEWRPVTLPGGAEVVVVHSGQARTLAGSGYADVRDRCVAATEALGDLRLVDPDAWQAVADPSVRAAARHVIGENRRVQRFVAAAADGDIAAMGEAMSESHRSLGELGVSTPELDALVDRLGSVPGVLGARLTGAGFGGCVVALCHHGSLTEGWRVRPSAGAQVRVERAKR